ncbi:Choline-sulfatase [Tsuneonella dongtanensis]|uniref:Choline-sulfatase n=1 Tax=Tsuneonella dongtanensis TaxID=692370 RepID=A0A1B2A8Z1_9SPHN|nr:sulfatase-like hydrolase/transferase [Tsuneonella dongtanensis]ANY18630.1 Choline-sulfatase [Tsuneonella dongtanensis]
MSLTRRQTTMLGLLGLSGCASKSLWPATGKYGTRREVRPNIVLIVFEDMSQRIRAFGDPIARTPWLDAFAEQSVLYPNAFATSGVCAPSRSSLITGVHQQTLGTHHMRTKSPMKGLDAGGPIDYEAVPPPSVKAFPELLRMEGYYTSNNGKTDYQFGDPFTVWDKNGHGADWSGRRNKQPFFAMFNILETHEGYIWPEDRESDDPLINSITEINRRDLRGKRRLIDADEVRIPPYLPNTPIVRRDLATHYDNIAFAERKAGDIVAKLDAEGLLDDTVIIVTTDHGDGLPRMKRTVYDSGIKVPLMVRLPKTKRAGTVDPRLVSFVDLAPTILGLAGADAPPFIQGRDFLNGPLRHYIFAAADRHDEVPGRTKAVRDARFKYIRNCRPDLAVLQHLKFRDALPTMQEIWRLAAKDTLTPEARRLVTAPSSREELYDTVADPDEVRNLVRDNQYQHVLSRLRNAMDAWIICTGDLSAIPERDMVEAMWPRSKQPKTAPPLISVEDNRAILSGDTPGSSIGYSVDNLDASRWIIYAGPVIIHSGMTIKAKAIRYGYAESDTVTYNIV